MATRKTGWFLLILLSAQLIATTACGQDIEPRRWTRLPAGTNVLAAGYLRTEGDIAFDPVLSLEDVTVEANTVVLSYVRSFELAGAPLRLDVLAPWQRTRWDGLLEGEPASATRSGFADPTLRLSINLLDSAEQQSADSSIPGSTRRTVAGAAIAMSLPLGEYSQDLLLNLGQNRFVFRPQAGVVHTRGPWSFELTGSAFLFGDNDEFFEGSERTQDPVYAVQTHAIYVFKPGLWASVSMAYGFGGESTVNGAPKDDAIRQFLSGFSVGVPIGKRQGLKFAYVRSRTNVSVGSDTDTIGLAWTARL